MKTDIFFWAINFVPVAIILAIVEIYNDTGQGIWAKTGPWGATKFVNPYWEEKMPINVPFLKYLSRYHGLMFLVIMPVLFVASMLIWSNALHYHVLPIGAPWYMSTLSVAILFGAIWLGNSGLEDFFYFAIQSFTGWHEPHALRKVIVEKDFEWFKDWVVVSGRLSIPGHWIFCPVISLVLLYIRQRWIMQ